MRRFAVLVVHAGSLILLAQQPDLERAWRLAGAGQRTEAIALLQTLIEQRPKDAEARLLLGSLEMEAGNREASLAHLRSAVELKPRSADARNALGEACAKFGETANARAAFEKAVTLAPNLAIARWNLGRTLLAAGELDGAAAQLDRALALLPPGDEAAEAHYLRARIDSTKGNATEAERQLVLAVRQKPRFAEAWSDLGQARRNLLDDSGALTAFQTAVQLNPRDPVAQYRLGAEYLRQRQSTAAIEHLQQAAAIDPSDQSTLNALQGALRQNGRAAEADAVRLELANLLRTRDETNQHHLAAVRLNNEGASLEKNGDLQGALGKYQQASGLYPEHVGICVNYAVALLRLGRWREGLETLHAAVARDPNDSRLRAALSDALRQAPRDTLPDWARSQQPQQ